MLRFIAKPLFVLLVIVISCSVHAVTSDGMETLTMGSYEAPIWHSDDFSGTHTRTLDEEQLNIQIDESSGGFDTAVLRSLPPIRVDQLESTFCVGFDYAINYAEGYSKDYMYYIGPKVMVTTTPVWTEDGWYENYIVENSNLSPETWDNYLTNAAGGEYLGMTTQDGSAYKHYKAPMGAGGYTWTQYWAIRQQFRNSGTVSIASIYQFWRSKGMPNGYLIEVRLNLETHGNMSGNFVIRNYNIAPSFESSCRTTNELPRRKWQL